MDRRTFLSGVVTLGGAFAAGLVGCGSKPATASAGSNGTTESGETDSASQTAPKGASSGNVDMAARTVTLNNGVTMPLLGIGTYILSPSQAEESVYAALMAGTRLVDTARIYGNEEGVGRGIVRSGVPREEIFLTTKLWTADFG